MNVSRSISWNPARNLGEFRQVFDRFLALDEAGPSHVVTSQWAPQVDIREEDKRFVIFADVPGVDPASIEVSMNKSILTLKGERKLDGVRDNGTEQAAGKLTRQERAHGTFHRRFALPESADAEGITAQDKFGVLEISIPKKAETTPRRIAIHTAN